MVAIDKEHIRHCILFAFQLRKNATNMISEDAVIHTTCEDRYERFREGYFNLNAPAKPQKFEANEAEQR